MNDTIIRPRRLPAGGTIGVLALASPCRPEWYQGGIDYLTALGYQVRVPFLPTAQWKTGSHLFAAESAAVRERAFTELVTDSSVDAIITARGGYGTLDVLPSLSLGLLRDHPKPVVGISDTTSLLVNLFARERILAFHGPIIAGGFHRAATDPDAAESVRRLLGVLSGTVQNPFTDVRLTHLCGPDTAVDGRVIGGNLTILASLAGTPWDVELADHILMIEDVGERPYRIHRCLTQLKLAGKLARIRAVLLGDFVDCQPIENDPAPLVDVFRDIFEPLGVPVWAGLPVGHGEPNYPLPIGAALRIAGGGVDILEPLVHYAVH